MIGVIVYITRAIEPIVKRYSEHFKVVVVTGPRQVGKTTMLKHLMEQDANKGLARSYVSLDNTSILQVAKSDPALFLQRYQPPVLIEEIQKAPELLPYIKEIVDSSDDKGAFWLTGSQPFHLMSTVSESLAGRAGIIEMLGLSGSEIYGTASEPFGASPEYFMRRIGMCSPQDVNQVYSDICKGSLPGIRALPDDLRPGGYESYLDTYIMRDIRDLAQVGDELKFRRFMTACDGTLFPSEVKKTASPSYKDARNLGVLDPVSKSDVPGELASFKRTIGTGCILCMAQDTYPISERAWAFPVWAL